MDRKSARIAAAILVVLAFALAIVGTIVRYSHGKPTDYTALLGAMFCLFFVIVVARPRGEK